jgi:hypothetical protein
MYALQVCALISFTCMCLATIDQFLATSLRPRWQQILTIKRAHFVCMLFFIIWLLHGIPALIWYNLVISPKTDHVSCSITNTVYLQYFTYFYLFVLAGILSILITVSFGCLAYRNVRQIPYRTVPLVRRELDKQLTSMILVQVVHNFFVVIPYIIVLFIIYTSNLTEQSPNYLTIVSAISITGLIYYLYFAVSLK